MWEVEPGNGGHSGLEMVRKKKVQVTTQFLTTEYEFELDLVVNETNQPTSPSELQMA